MLLLLAGCAAPAAVRQPKLLPGVAGVKQWRDLHRQLEAVAVRYKPASSYTMNVALELSQPQLGQRMRARGAIAVAPGALRMILLGPGGTTALDLWLCGDRFRFALPALDMVRRGDDTTPRDALRGLPVDFLRWWFLRPFAGRLLFAEPGRWMLRDGLRWVRVRHKKDELRVERFGEHEAEEVRVRGDACGQVTYHQRSTGIDIAVRCERLQTMAPPAKAFADPDDMTVACRAGGADP